MPQRAALLAALITCIHDDPAALMPERPRS